MDLSAWLLRHAPPRPLMIATPGGTGARLATERVVRERGWRAAASPAEANILVVAGAVEHDLQPYLDQVWSLMPAPRARADVDSAGSATAELDAAATALRDADRQREQARAPQSDHEMPEHEAHNEHDSDEHGHAAHGGNGADEHPHGEHHAEHDEEQEPDQHSHDHGQHGHDMGGMPMPGDLPMADRAEDRDGLKLDQLHVPLGPVLPDWPAGLVVRASVQGDVIQEASVEAAGLAGAGETSFWGSPGRTTARRLDSCARLLSVAGWPDAAATARRLRDDTLRDDVPVGTARALQLWVRRVRRSRTLRWLLAGVGVTPGSAPVGLAGDALERLYRWLDSAVQAFDRPDAGESGVDAAHETEWSLEVLPAMLAGTELAIARLVVASLDPDLGTLARRAVRHG